MKIVFNTGKPSLIPFLALALWLFPAAPAQAGRDSKVTNGSNFTIIYRPGYGLFGSGTNGSSYLLGLGVTTSSFTSFQSISSTETWTHLESVNARTYAIHSDSTLWGWGSGATNAFGNNSTANLTVPTQVNTDHWIALTPNVTAASARAIRADSTLWAWGSNTSSSYLGDGTSTTRPTPVQIGGAGSKWLDVSSISGHSLAVKADSTLWAWGNNNSGQFGNGTTSGTATSSPAQIGTDKWMRVCAGDLRSFAIKSDSTLWASGSNGSGLLGLGTTTGNQTTFAQVGTGKWIKLVYGRSTVMALKADSTLWTWGAAGSTTGSSTYGVFGQGAKYSDSVPSQIGTSKWRDFFIGASDVIAQDRAGDYWAWGRNSSGAFGNGTSGTNNWATTPTRIYPGLASQTLTFGALGAKAYGDADFDPGASASSGLTVSYASSDPAVATIVSGKIHIVGPGTATITASQGGNSSYMAATDVTQSLTVGKASQTITFGALTSKTYGDAAFSLGATASSGLTVTYASSDPSVATVSGSTVTVVGAGTTTLTASQAGNANYAAATDATQSLTVGKAAQTLAFPALASKTLGDADFAPGAAAGSGLAVAYASSDPSVATIVSGQIHIVGAGTTVITASQAGDANHLAAPDSSVSLTVAKTPQSITFGALSAKTFGDAAFALTATASSGLSVSYASSDTTVATVSGTTVTLIGAGSATLTASQAGNGTYSAATDVARALTVNKASQTLAFPALSARNTGDADFAPGASASSGLAVAYASSNPSVATIVSGQIHIVGAGTTVITASQAGNANHLAAADSSLTLTVNAVSSQATQSITFGTLAAKTFGDAAFALTATASSNLAVSYASSDTNVARISGSTVTLKGAGTALITASQAGNGSYSAAADVARTLTVGKAAQILTFNALAEKSVGDADFAPGASASSGLTVSYASSDASVATIVAGQIHIVGAGTATITASQTGDANHNAAANTQQTLTVVQNQILVFNPLPEKTYGDADFDPGAAAVPGHALGYASSNPAVATVAAGKIHIVGAGVTIITATQESGSGSPDTSAARTLTVNKAAQTLSLGPLAAKTFGDSDIAPGAVASSGLQPSYASSDPAVAAIVDGKIHLTGSGTAIIMASQAGDGNYLAAPPVDQALAVSQAAQSLAFQLGSDSLKTEGDAPFRLIAVSSAGLAARFSSSDTAVAKVRGDSAWATGVGSAILTASQDGDSRFAAAASVTQAIRVRTAPPSAIDVSRIPVSPKEGTGSTVELDWPAPARATGYRFQASMDTASAPRLDTLLSHKGFTLSGLVPGSAHFWRVAAVNGLSAGPFTPWFGFRVRLQDESGVSRGVVVDSTEPVKLSGVVSVAAKSGSAPAITVTVTEEKKAPANMPAGFVPLTGSISLAAVSGGTSVGDSQVSITLAPPDTALDGRRLDPAERPSVYTLDSATGALEAVFDLARDPDGRIVFPLSKGKSFLLAVDTVPPVVRDSTPAEVRQAGNPPVIRGIVDDNIRNCRTVLYYRQGGSDVFDSVSVAIDATGRFELPLDLKLDSTGFEYHLTADDGRNLKRTPATNMPIEVKVIRSADSLPAMQWRLFALPTLPGDFQWSGLAADLGVYGKDWKFFARDGEGLREFGAGLDKAEAGRAYWLKSRRGFLPRLAAGVTAPIDKPFEIVLPPKGWVSFGNPFLFPVAWQRVLDSTHAPSGALLGPYTYRDTAWVAPLEIPALIPWEGYYAYNASDDTLRMRIPARKARNLEPLLAQTAFHLQWQVRGPDGKDGGNIFGGLASARPATALGKAAATASVWRFPKPEAPDAGLRAGFLSDGKAAGLLQTDFQVAGREGGLAWTARLTGLRPGQRYANRLEGFSGLPEGMAVALADAATGSFVPWNAGEAYTVEAQPGEPFRDLRFFAGSPEYVASMGTAFTAAHPFALELGNYPNPVRTSTLVHFTVPASAAGGQHVKVAVYDMRGTMVKLLAEGARATGRYSLRWDVRDGKDTPLPAGSYRLLLQVGAKKRSCAVQIL